MRKFIIGGLALALAVPLLAPTDADAASCRSRKATGTIVGGLGGVLLGDAVTHGAAGPIIGGVGGALVGREIGKNGCRRTRAAAPARNYQPARASAPRQARPVYYNSYGQPVGAYQPASYAGRCRVVTRTYYDHRGAAVSRPVEVCS